MNKIPERLVSTLKSKGMTQRELSDATDISPHVISYYANGHRVPKSRNLMLIAKALDVSAEYLLGDEPTKCGKWWKVPMTLKKNPQFIYMMYRCSECKTVYESKTNYCPHCGAKMDKRKEE